MTAVINPPASSLTNGSSNEDGDASTASQAPRPNLINKIDGFQDRVSAAVLLVHEDGVITACEDRSVRVFLKRETGRYWPSICHYLPAPCLCLDYNEETFRLFVGTATGVVSEYALAEDYNSLTHKRDFSAHTAGVNCVRLALTCDWLLTAGKDKHFVWMCSETTRRFGSFDCGSSCLCLEFDAAARYAFVGDFAGHISVLSVQDNKCELVTKLSAHLASVRSLAWDAERQLLFSGSFDQLIIVWDIGGRRGTAYELNGHRGRVFSVCYSASSRRLYSCSDSGHLLAWDMDAERKETPEWKSADLCQRCDAPFFWNVKTMWERRTVGLRQHHCRLCGLAVCAKCSSQRTTYPVMGYELAVRACDGCWNTLQQRKQDDAAEYANRMRPLAVSVDGGVCLLALHLNDTMHRLLCIGSDRVVRMYDVADLQRTTTTSGGGLRLMSAAGSSSAASASRTAHVDNLNYGVGQLAANTVVTSRAHNNGNASNAGNSQQQRSVDQLSSPFA